MPRVPVAENRVNIASVSDVKLQPADTGAGGFGRGLEAVGQGLGQFAEARHQYDVAYDEAAVKTLDNQLVPQLRGIRTGVLSKQGLDAVGAATAATDQFKALRESTLAAAKTERQRKMIGDLFDRRAAMEADSITTHSNEQLLKANQLASGARADLGAEEAVSAYGDDAKFTANLQTGLDETANLWKPYGADVVKEKQHALTSGVYRNVIRNKIDGDDVTGALALRAKLPPGTLTSEDDNAVDAMLKAPVQARTAASDLADAKAAVMGAPKVETAPGKALPGDPMRASVATVSPDMVFAKGLVPQESGGRRGVAGPDTQWGRAHGLTQLLDGTGEQMAKKLGIDWRPDLLRGDSDEAAAYQLKLGRAYFNEGLDKYGGDVRKALMYFHGGPNEKQWGPKTRDYAANIMKRVGLDPGQPAASNQTVSNVDQLDQVSGYLDKEVAAGRMSPERRDRAMDRARSEMSTQLQERNLREQDADRAVLDTIDKLPGQKLTDWSQVPADVRARLSPSQRVQYDAEIARNTSPKAIPENGPQALALDELAVVNPEAFGKTDLRKFQSQVTPSEFARFKIQQDKYLHKPAEAVGASTLWTAVGRYGADAGLDMSPKKQGESDDAFKQRRTDGYTVFKTMRSMLDLVTEGKRQPTDQEVKYAFDQAVITTQVTKPGWFGSTTEAVPRYRNPNISPTALSIPPAEKDKIRATLKAAGQPTDDGTIARIYFARQAKNN